MALLAVSSTTQDKLSQALLSALVEQGFLTNEQIAIMPPNLSGAALEDYLITQGIASADTILQAYAKAFNVPFVRLKLETVKPETVRLVPELVARRYDLAAFDKNGDILSVAMASPGRFKTNQSQGVGLLHRLQDELQTKIALNFAPLSDIRALHQYYGQTPTSPAAPTVPAAQSAGQPAQVQVTVSPQDTVPVPVATTQSSDSGLFKSPDLPTVDLTGREIGPELLKKFPPEIIQKYRVIPFEEPRPGSMSVAVLPPISAETQLLLDFVQRHNALTLTLYQADQASFEQALQRHGLVPTSQPPLDTQVAAINQPAPLETAQPSLEPAAPQPAAEQPVMPPQDAVVPQVTADQIAVAHDKLTNLQIGLDRNTSGQPNPTAVVQAAKVSENRLDAFLEKDILSINDLVSMVQSGNVPKMVAAFVALAINMRASDIHIEATKDQLRLRYRIDGELTDMLLLPRTLLAPVVSRVKILSEMKIDENRVPQDGRFDVVFKNRDIDLRVSTLPTVHGEKLVMRILDKSNGILSLENMGIDGTAIERLNENIMKPYGVILATGPTGSGKSTTLYAALQKISRPNVNIVTLEDPVEYEIAGINQTQIKPKIGFTFAEGLRSILRQDPNVIMVGEIRDKETAEMATHAALTGHLVLSTLHTNTAAGALPRLINMGIEPFLITSSINAVIGQRLVRRVCQECKARVELPPAVMESIKAELASSPVAEQYADSSKWEFFAGKGCPKCTNGYKGRIGIYEVMVMSEEIESLAVKKEPESSIQEQAVKEGMLTMRQDGLIKALRGLTTVEEVMKAATS